MESDFSIFLDVAQTLGTWAIFLYLFLQERAAHERSRAAHMADLRDIAGMSDRLSAKSGSLLDKQDERLG